MYTVRHTTFFGERKKKQKKKTKNKQTNKKKQKNKKTKQQQQQQTNLKRQPGLGQLEPFHNVKMVVRAREIDGHVAPVIARLQQACVGCQHLFEL